jgi:signal peptidase II
MSISIAANPMSAELNGKTAEFSRWKRWFLPVFATVLAADQISKYWIFSLPADADLPGWIELSFNKGVAWGVFDGQPGGVLAMTLVLIPVLTWVYWKHFRPVGPWQNLAFGLILGGALGNAWDRIMTNLADPSAGFQGVRDFIRVDLGFMIWPNFNIADSAISVGFCLLLLLAVCYPTEKCPGADRAS